MASAISANKAELLAIANSVASEKMIDKAIVIEAMEEAIQKSARNRYGAENDIRAKLDPLTGDLRLWRVVEVVEEVEDYFKQVDLLEVVFDFLDHFDNTPQAQIAGQRIELGTDIVFGAVAVTGRFLDRLFHRFDDDRLVDHLFRSDRVCDREEFSLVGGNGAGHQSSAFSSSVSTISSAPLVSSGWVAAISSSVKTSCAE